MRTTKKLLSIVFTFVFTMFTMLCSLPVQAAVKKAVVPEVQFASSTVTEYTAGDRVKFNIKSPNFGGKVEYRVILWNDSTKSYSDLWNAKNGYTNRYYTKWQPTGNTIFTLGWPISEPGNYRIKVFAKRVGVTNSKAALKGMNCDSYIESVAFTVKPAVASSTIFSVQKGTVNPNGGLDEVFLIKGDSLKGDIVIQDNDNLLPKKSDSAATKLNIFHVNDMHGNIMTFNSKGDTHNLAQMKLLVDNEKSNMAKNEATIWVSAGDDHIGSILDELLGNDEKNFIESPAYTSYSAAGFDFAVLGNHEFDKYTPILSKAINENAKFPIIESNIFNSKYNLNTSVAAIGVANGIRIGVIGVTIPEETKLATKVDPDIYGEQPIEAIKKLVPVMKDYCDTFLILCHVGYEKSDRYTIKSGDSAIANLMGELTDKPSVVVGGHTHENLNVNGLDPSNIFNGIPVVQAGQYGTMLGKVTVCLDNKNYEAKLIPIISGKATTDGTPFESVNNYDMKFQKEIIDPMRSFLNEKMNTIIGYTDGTNLISNELNAVDRYIGESAMANYINDAVVKRISSFTTAPVDFSMCNATGIAGLKLNSKITFGVMYAMFPYADTISVVNMKGKDIKDIIENNAPRIIPEAKLIQNGGKLDPNGFIETGYLNFSEGIRYKIRFGETSDKNTAEDITLNGEPIENVLNKDYKVALSSYLVIGRGGWQGTAVGQGLPENFIGYNLKKICSENGHDLGISFRNELFEFVRNDSKGLIGAETGVIKDGRVTIIK